MEHLLVRLLSHESYVIHMYSYVIHNKMMIKSYCNIYIYMVTWSGEKASLPTGPGPVAAVALWPH